MQNHNLNNLGDSTVRATNRRIWTLTQSAFINKDLQGKTVGLTYDNANNLKTLTDAANRVTSYYYDAKNQIDKVKQNSINVADYDWLKTDYMPLH